MRHPSAEGARVATVAACVVSHDDAHRLPACLDALLAQQLGRRLRVGVVCNLRGDGSAALVRERFPTVGLIEQPTPRGFGENQNAGFAAWPGDFCLVLNPDVVLEPGCVRALLHLMDERPRCGLAAPALVFPDGTPQQSARRFPEPLDTIARRTPLRLLLRNGGGAAHYLDVPRSPRAIDWAIGACLLVRRVTWAELGGFDDGFRLYVEDIDLAWRAWEAGWEVWQTPAARASHEYQGAIDRSFLTRRTVWHARGMARFVRKHPRVLRGGRPPVRALRGDAT